MNRITAEKTKQTTSMIAWPKRNSRRDETWSGYAPEQTSQCNRINSWSEPLASRGLASQTRPWLPLGLSAMGWVMGFSLLVVLAELLIRRVVWIPREINRAPRINGRRPWSLRVHAEAPSSFPEVRDVAIKRALEQFDKTHEESMSRSRNLTCAVWMECDGQRRTRVRCKEPRSCRGERPRRSSPKAEKLWS